MQSSIVTWTWARLQSLAYAKQEQDDRSVKMPTIVVCAVAVFVSTVVDTIVVDVGNPCALHIRGNYICFQHLGTQVILYVFVICVTKKWVRLLEVEMEMTNHVRY